MFTAVLLPAQNINSGARGSGASIEVSPNPVGRNDRIGVTIQVPVDDASMVVVDGPELDDNIRLLRGPYIRPVYSTGPNGEQLKRTEITYVYRCASTGRFEISPYRISGVDRVYSTQPQLLEVGVYRNRELIIPLELEWRVSEESAYVGQNIVSVLTALEQPEIGMFEEVSVGSPAEGFFQAAEGVGSINRISRGGQTLYEVPVAGYMFTPSTPGEVALPQARVNYEYGQAVSDRPVIQVRPLPEGVRQTGAVGNFRVEAEVEKDEIKMGERVTLTVKVAGTGNLNYMEFPQLNLQGFTQVQNEEATNYEPTQNGYRGSRTYVYTLVAEKAGTQTIEVASMNALDPGYGRIYSTRPFRFNIEVMPVNAESAQHTDDDTDSFAPVQPDSMVSADVSTLFLQIESYAWLLPGPLLFILFFILTRRKLALLIPLMLLLLSFGVAEFPSKAMLETIQKAQAAFEQGEFTTAEALYLDAVRRRPDVPDLRYNAALSAFQSGETGASVLYTRTALVMRPMNDQYKAFLEYIAQEKGVNTDIGTPFLFHPDFFLLLLTLFVNGAGFLGIIYLFRQKNGYFIVAAFMLVVSIAVSIGLVYSVARSNQHIGVVMSQKDFIPPVKKIPRESASEAFTLKDGEVLKIKGTANDFFFIETALGQKGWVRKSGVEKVPDIKKLASE